jgi:hypothetical protein
MKWDQKKMFHAIERHSTHISEQVDKWEKLEGAEPDIGSV